MAAADRQACDVSLVEQRLFVDGFSDLEKLLTEAIY
jgi:hypothetical protein